MGSPDALNRGAKEGKGKGTSQPGHGAATYKIIACIERATVLRANITGVSNHWNGIWNGIWNGTVEWKMEWNGECS